MDRQDRLNNSLGFHNSYTGIIDSNYGFPLIALLIRLININPYAGPIIQAPIVPIRFIMINWGAEECSN
ncbi:MAG: hypothetical protein WBZ36_17390 [Candidatus Nitrosopolaris sp.]